MDHLSPLRTWCTSRTPDDRGDVPGWVLVTVMSVGLVTALLAFAQPALVDMLRSALNSVR